MPQTVKCTFSPDNIHRDKHEPMEDHHDTSPQGRGTGDRINQNQEGDIPGCLTKSTTLHSVSQSPELRTPEDQTRLPAG